MPTPPPETQEMIATSEARAQFADLTRRAHYHGDRIILSSHGKPFVAIVPYEDIEILERVEDELLAKKALAAIEKSDGIGIPFKDVVAKLFT